MFIEFFRSRLAKKSKVFEISFKASCEAGVMVNPKNRVLPVFGILTKRILKKSLAIWM